MPQSSLHTAQHSLDSTPPPSSSYSLHTRLQQQQHQHATPTREQPQLSFFAAAPLIGPQTPPPPPPPHCPPRHGSPRHESSLRVNDSRGDALLFEREMVILEKERLLETMAREARLQQRHARDTLAAADLSRLASEHERSADLRTLQFSVSQLQAQLSAAQLEASEQRERADTLQALLSKQKEDSMIYIHGVEAENMRLSLALEAEASRAKECTAISQEALRELHVHEQSEASLSRQLEESQKLQRREITTAGCAVQTGEADFEKVEHLLSRVMGLEQEVVEKQRLLRRGEESGGGGGRWANGVPLIAHQSSMTNAVEQVPCYPTPVIEPANDAAEAGLAEAQQQIAELARTASRLSETVSAQKEAILHIAGAVSEVASNESFCSMPPSAALDTVPLRFSV